MDEKQTMTVLLAALTDAARTHGVYEETELAGVYDENWPEWYARYMTRALADRGYRIT